MEKMTVSSNYTIALWATFTAISFAVGYQLGTSNASSTKKSSATLLRSKEMKEGKLHNDTDEEESESEDESDEDEDIESHSLNDIPGEVRMVIGDSSRSWHDKGQNSGTMLSRSIVMF